MKPFVFLATRADDVVADDEYAAMLRYTGLGEDQLERVRMERVSLGEVDLARWSGIIVGGSPFNVSDPLSKKSAVQQRVEAEMSALLDKVVPADFPFFGACYGIGALVVHQGGVIDRTYGEPAGTVAVSLTDVGRADPVFGQLPETFGAFVGHKEAVAVVPMSAEVLASSPGCPVHALRVGANVYATQYHPELDAVGMCVRVDAYVHEGYFEPAAAEEVKDAARRADVTHAGEALAHFVARHAT